MLIKAKSFGNGTCPRFPTTAINSTATHPQRLQWTRISSMCLGQPAHPITYFAWIIWAKKFGKEISAPSRPNTVVGSPRSSFEIKWLLLMTTKKNLLSIALIVKLGKPFGGLLERAQNHLHQPRLPMYLIPDKFSLYATPSPMVALPWTGGQEKLPGKPERTLLTSGAFPHPFKQEDIFLPPVDRADEAAECSPFSPQAGVMNRLLFPT